MQTWIKGSRRRPVIVVGFALTAVLAAACGSSSSGDSASTSPSSAGSVAASSSAASSTPAAASGSVAAAVAATNAAEKVPTTIPITVPLKTAPPPGKTFVWLQCELAQCKTMTQGYQAATAAAGWKLKIIDYQNANPATFIAGMKQALQYKPVAVVASGLPVAVWGSAILPLYKKANVPIIMSYIGTQPLDSTLIANIGGPPTFTNSGNDIANWVTADSKGQAHVLFYHVPDFSVFHVFADAFSAQITKACPGCKVTNLSGSIAQAEGGQSVPAIVSALQKDPSIHYVVSDNGAWVIGLPAAAKAAGLSVKIAGQGATVTNLSDIKSGTENAWTGLALHFGSWEAVDAAIRHVEGMPIVNGNSLMPSQLLTSSDSFAVSDSYDQPADYAAQMKKLWHVQ